MSGVINYLIGVAALVFTISRLKARRQADPGFTILGMNLESLIKFAFIGIACFFILMLTELLS